MTKTDKITTILTKMKMKTKNMKIKFKIITKNYNGTVQYSNEI